jgi:hypothetical protein
MNELISYTNQDKLFKIILILACMNRDTKNYIGTLEMIDGTIVKILNYFKGENNYDNQ